MTRFGEEIDAADDRAREASATDWHRVLDAYEQAREQVDKATVIGDLNQARDTLTRGRKALKRITGT
ncbi:hypothetical protein ACWENQ_10085 [Nonomuraea sp. NPDC004354]